MKNHWDVLVVGAGPAGLAAAINAAGEGLQVAVYDGGHVGGQAHQSARIENYPGFAFGITGRDLANEMMEQAERLGAVIIRGMHIKKVGERVDQYVRIDLQDDHEVLARAVLVACGMSYRKLGCPGEDLPQVKIGAGADVASSARDADVVVVGGGNSAAQAAIHLARFAATVTMLIRGPSLAESASSYLVNKLTSSRVHLRTSAQIARIDSLDEGLCCCTLADQTRLPASLVVVHIGGVPHTSWLDSRFEKEGEGYIVTGGRPDRSLYETNVPGVFAVGDARARSIKRLATAVGEGSAVIPTIQHFLR